MYFFQNSGCLDKLYFATTQSTCQNQCNHENDLIGKGSHKQAAVELLLNIIPSGWQGAGNGQEGRKAWKREGRGSEQRERGKVEGKETRE